MARVNDCALPYARAPDAAATITACGLRLIALDGDAAAAAVVAADADAGETDEDAEVGALAPAQPQQHALHPSPLATSDGDSEDDEAMSESARELTSPDNVMDIDVHEAFHAGPDVFSDKPPAAFERSC